MCTTIGFLYQGGVVFGRTLEIGVEIENKILYIPKNEQGFITAKGRTFNAKYATLGSAFLNIASFGDGINEMGLMGSNNFFPKYASFAKEAEEEKLNMTISNAFDYLLSRCRDVNEVKKEAEHILLVEQVDQEEGPSMQNHFFFMDVKGDTLVLEPKQGQLVTYDNPYGVLTNAPDFSWHSTNLKNYIHLKPENIEQARYNDAMLTKFGEGTGMLGLPGDFTPPSRFVRAAYFVAQTAKDLERHEALLQAFRILGQFDIPKGAIVDSIHKHQDQTLYTSVMDTKELGYYIKGNTNTNIQRFNIKDYANVKQAMFIELKKRWSYKWMEGRKR